MFINSTLTGKQFYTENTTFFQVGVEFVCEMIIITLTGKKESG